MNALFCFKFKWANNREEEVALVGTSQDQLEVWDKIGVFKAY